ncbi:MAG: transposase [Rhodocyclaceae bacterium]|nr:transposase [Rhodocyclaceae bacterium]
MSIDDSAWAKIEELLPPRKTHPAGTHNPRIPDRAAMEAILVFLEGGHSWDRVGRLSGLSKSSVYRRYREWSDAGVIDRLAILGLTQPWRERRRTMRAPIREPLENPTQP